MERPRISPRLVPEDVEVVVYPEAEAETLPTDTPSRVALERALLTAVFADAEELNPVPPERVAVRRIDPAPMLVGLRTESQS